MSVTFAYRYLNLDTLSATRSHVTSIWTVEVLTLLRLDLHIFDLYFDVLTWRHALFLTHWLPAGIRVLFETPIVRHCQSKKLAHPKECEDTLQSPYVTVSRLDTQPVKSTLHAQEQLL